MVAYLSDEWIAALHDAATSSEALRAASIGRHLVVEQVVTDGDGAARWHVVLDDGSVSVVPGAADAPTVRFTTDRSTAAGISRGEQSAQRAFLRGDLQVGGDTGALVAHAELLGSLDDAFAEVRRTTDW